LFLFFVISSIIQVINDKIILNKRATKNPLTLKPGNIAAAKPTIKAFITRVNSPNVKMFIGKVKKIKIGRIKEFIAPKTMAANKAAPKPEI